MKTRRTSVKFPFILAALIGLLSGGLPNALAGQDGNGGDIVFCTRSSESALNGHYALDFVASLADASNITVLPAATLDESLDRIERALDAKLPFLIPDFRLFRKSLLRPVDWSVDDDYGWEGDHQSLIPVSDERLRRLLPANCDAKTIEQAVIRERIQRKIIFHFDKEDLDRLTPLQLSFLVIHEWLWSYTVDVQQLRRLNKFLHSQEIQAWDEAKVLIAAKNMGFNDGLLVPSKIYRAFREALRLAGQRPLLDEALKELNSIYESLHGNFRCSSFYVSEEKEACTEIKNGKEPFDWLMPKYKCHTTKKAELVFSFPSCEKDYGKKIAQQTKQIYQSCRYSKEYVENYSGENECVKRAERYLDGIIAHKSSHYLRDARAKVKKLADMELTLENLTEISKLLTIFRDQEEVQKQLYPFYELKKPLEGALALLSNIEYYFSKERAER